MINFTDYAQRLSKNQVTVYIRPGGEIYCNSKTKIIVLPEQIPTKNELDYKIFLDHEISHFLWPVSYPFIYSQEYNIIDDHRIEANFKKKYLGCENQFLELRRKLFARQNGSFYNAVSLHLAGLQDLVPKQWSKLVNDYIKESNVEKVVNENNMELLPFAAKLLQEYGQRTMRKLEKKGETDVAQKVTDIALLPSVLAEHLQKEARNKNGEKMEMGSIGSLNRERISIRTPLKKQYLNTNLNSNFSAQISDCIAQLHTKTKQVRTASNFGKYNSKRVAHFAAGNYNYAYLKNHQNKSEAPIFSILYDISDSMRALPYKKYKEIALQFGTILSQQGLLVQLFEFNHELYKLKSFDSNIIYAGNTFPFGATFLSRTVETVQKAVHKEYSNRMHHMFVFTDDANQTEFRDAEMYINKCLNVNVHIISLDRGIEMKSSKNYNFCNINKNGNLQEIFLNTFQKIVEQCKIY